MSTLPASAATAAAGRSIVRYTRRDDDDVRQRPLDFRLIARLMGCTRPYARKRNLLLAAVLIRAVQLPALMWIVAALIKGPITQRDLSGVVWGSVAFGLLAICTQFVFHFRQRWGLELGEAVVADLRQQLFEHLQAMPMSWFHRTKTGRIISRMTSDIEDVRIGVQQVLFVSLVQLGQMLIAAVAMIWYDHILFLIVLGLAPIIWAVNRHFHRKLSHSLRRCGNRSVAWWRRWRSRWRECV